jgi:hypothetical protein
MATFRAPKALHEPEALQAPEALHAPEALTAPDLGPTLPALVRRRFGVRERLTTIAALLLVAAVATGLLVHSYATRPKQLVYRAGPTFNLQYASHVLHRVAPNGGELVRLEAHRPKLFASITIGRLHLPPYGANVTSGLLPVFMHGYEQQLRRIESDFQLRDEGSARVNSAQGYQVGFRSGPEGHFTWGRDVLLVPRDENVQDGIVLRLRQSKVGTVNKRDVTLLDAVRKAFRSFDFGTDRAKW